jgi:hypothetical protein
MMMESKLSRGYLVGWLGVGGEQTLSSYGSASFKTVPEAHWRFIEETLPYVQTDTHFMVDAKSNIPLESQTEDALY